ncbi:hypothetical protein [Nostoc sp.]|uniref:hypothetical protein n=1 Tax=Nostoc sp. TaxID=1180 RepID=UPI002FFD3883
MRENIVSGLGIITWKKSRCFHPLWFCKFRHQCKSQTVETIASAIANPNPELPILSNRIKVPVVRIHLGILYDWWMNNRRLRPPPNFLVLWSSISRGSESPTDSVTLSRVRVRF